MNPEEKPALSITDGTWHIGLSSIFGEGVRRGKPFTKNLDIYPVFEEGKLVNGLATARTFNTSIHLLESSDVAVDVESKSLKGNMKILMTPDSWLPQDGKSFVMSVDLEGSFTEREDGSIGLSGSYEATRSDGKTWHDGSEKITGNMGGSVGRTELDWDKAFWSAGMTPEAQSADEIDQDSIQLVLGVQDGVVKSATMGIMAQAKWGSHMPIRLEKFEFEPEQNGKIKGQIEITERHLHPAGDPEKLVKAELHAYRVQGLNGMKLLMTYEDGRQVQAAGRGSARRGSGEHDFSQLWRYELDTRDWYTAVPGFEAVSSGEHPRLLFRKKDVPALRAKAETPLGKAILARLRVMLGENGEAVTKIFNETPSNNLNKSPKGQPQGTFTSWHAAGFGFLYQVTGEQKYADLAKECVELMLAGKMDRDNRYGWLMPGTTMRASNVLGAMGYAYDFCYEAWPEEFRQKIALEIQNYANVTATAQGGWEKKKAEGKPVGDAPEPTTVSELVGRTGYPPGSNHYGAMIGGVSVALMAIREDPAVDTEWVDARLAEAESNVSRLLAYGFGDGGYYAEGFPPSRLSSEGGLIQMLHALKNVMGRDYINVERSNARNLTLRWVYHVGGSGKGMFPSRGTYGGDDLYQEGVRGSFAQGLGAVPEQYKGAVLWTYNQFFDRFESGAKTFNAGTTPHQAIYAFVNWPEHEAQNPEEVLPHLLVDHDHGYFVARNRWQDENDIIVTHLVENGPKGYYAARDGQPAGRSGRMRIWGLGKKVTFDVQANGKPTYFAAGEDGSFSLTAGNQVMVDFSKASGADLVVVSVEDPKRKKKKRKANRVRKAPSPIQSVQLDVDGQAYTANIFVLSEGEKPAVVAEGASIQIGGQRFLFDGKNLEASVFTPAGQL